MNRKKELEHLKKLTRRLKETLMDFDEGVSGTGVVAALAHLVGFVTAYPGFQEWPDGKLEALISDNIALGRKSVGNKGAH